MSRRRAATRLLAWTRYLTRYDMLSTPGYRRAVLRLLRNRRAVVVIDAFPYLWARTCGTGGRS